jgi:hypothetical protein
VCGRQSGWIHSVVVACDPRAWACPLHRVGASDRGAWACAASVRARASDVRVDPLDGGNQMPRSRGRVLSIVGMGSIDGVDRSTARVDPSTPSSRWDRSSAGIDHEHVWVSPIGRVVGPDRWWGRAPTWGALARRAGGRGPSSEGMRSLHRGGAFTTWRGCRHAMEGMPSRHGGDAVTPWRGCRHAMEGMPSRHGGDAIAPSRRCEHSIERMGPLDGGDAIPPVEGRAATCQGTPSLQRRGRITRVRGCDLAGTRRRPRWEPRKKAYGALNP